MLPGLQVFILQKTTRPQKIVVGKKYTGPTYHVCITQRTAQFGILSTLEESHIRKKFGKLPAPCTKTEIGWAEKGDGIDI
ncbi:uncharacterized protein LOC113482599 [Athene cunicularia]|uniref:uncharacterized protein LOC113482599 n=1 Tax=Athene cunicularia TaxID=194338 RepID=UPI000EF67ED3|nr:uncharacterized protein LOC113482599 [Athene cunicularia]